MGDYQNAAPPVHGLHFQPPVPDTTFGPMQHVYVPRHDGGLAGLQVGAPASFNFVSAAPFAISPTPLTASSTSSYTTVVVPKTFYLNGYTYYASLLCWFTFLFCLSCGLHLDQVVQWSSPASSSGALWFPFISFHFVFQTFIASINIY
jgi:hypothetical protein